MTWLGRKEGKYPRQRAMLAVIAHYRRAVEAVRAFLQALQELAELVSPGTRKHCYSPGTERSRHYQKRMPPSQVPTAFPTANEKGKGGVFTAYIHLRTGDSKREKGISLGLQGHKILLWIGPAILPTFSSVA